MNRYRQPLCKASGFKVGWLSWAINTARLSMAAVRLRQAVVSVLAQVADDGFSEAFEAGLR